MHIPVVRLGLWCLYYAASVAAPLVVEARGGTFSGSWQWPDRGTGSDLTEALVMALVIALAVAMT